MCCPKSMLTPCSPNDKKHPKVRSYARSFPNVLLWVQTCLLTMLSENNWSRRRILWKKRWIRYMAIFEYKTCLFCISIVYTYSFCLLWYPQPIVATERCTLYIYILRYFPDIPFPGWRIRRMMLWKPFAQLLWIWQLWFKLIDSLDITSIIWNHFQFNFTMNWAQVCITP